MNRIAATISAVIASGVLGCAVAPEGAEGVEGIEGTGATSGALVNDECGNGFAFHKVGTPAWMGTGISDYYFNFSMPYVASTYGSTEQGADLVTGLRGDSNEGRTLVYDRATKSARVFRVAGSNGAMTVLRNHTNFPSDGAAWDMIVQLNGSSVFAYRVNGTARLYRFDWAGNFWAVRSFSGFSPWTTITASSGPDGILFYDRASGIVVVGHFDVAGNFYQSSVMTPTMYSGDGADFVTWDTKQHIFYKRSTGVYYGVVFNEATSTFSFTHANALSGFDSVVSRANGQTLFYRRSDGYSLLKDFQLNGSAPGYGFILGSGWDFVTSAGDTCD